MLLPRLKMLFKNLADRFICPLISSIGKMKGDVPLNHIFKCASSEHTDFLNS